MLFDFPGSRRGGGSRFVYVLPEVRSRPGGGDRVRAPRTATHARAGPRPRPSAATCRDVVSADGYEILRAESAVLPLRLDAGRRRTGRVLAIGAAGGMVKASTGYAYSRIQRDSAAIAARWSATATRSTFRRRGRRTACLTRSFSRSSTAIRPARAWPSPGCSPPTRPSGCPSSTSAPDPGRTEVDSVAATDAVSPRGRPPNCWPVTTGRSTGCGVTGGSGAKARSGCCPTWPTWVVAQERDPWIAAHVPLLGEATHRVDPTHSLSKSHHATDGCGRTSGKTLVSTATGGHSTRGSVAGRTLAGGGLTPFSARCPSGSTGNASPCARGPRSGRTSTGSHRRSP